jgi:hypothetical protein
VFPCPHIDNANCVYTILEVPGAPENISATSVTASSFRLQAHLSTVGTSPILSASFRISGPDGLVSHNNVTDDVLVGGPVMTDVTGLAPATYYTVAVYATNAAGSGPDSMERKFQTCMLVTLCMYKHKGVFNIGERASCRQLPLYASYRA